MKKNMLLINICVVFLILSIGCTVAGYLNKDNNENLYVESKDINNTKGMDNNESVNKNNIVEGEKYPNFVGKKYDDVKEEIETFAKNHNIKIELKYVKDTNKSLNIIAKQIPTNYDTIQDGSTLEIMISKNKHYVEDIYGDINEDEFFSFEGHDSDDEEKLKLKDDDSIISSNEKYFTVLKYLDEDKEKSQTLVVNRKTYKTLLSEKGNISKSNHVPIFQIKNGYIILEQKCIGTCSDYYTKVYSSNLKLLASKSDDIIFSDDNILIRTGSTLFFYNKSGEQIKKLNNVIDIYEKFILLEEEDSIKILTLDDEKTTIAKKNNNLKYKEMIHENEFIYIYYYDNSIKKKDYIKYCNNDNYCPLQEDELDKHVKYGRYYIYYIDDNEISGGLTAYSTKKEEDY